MYHCGRELIRRPVSPTLPIHARRYRSTEGARGGARMVSVADRATGPDRGGPGDLRGTRALVQGC
jgi:hypothetical protein